MIGPEIGTSKTRDYADDLEEGGAMVARDTRGGVHGLEEF